MTTIGNNHVTTGIKIQGRYEAAYEPVIRKFPIDDEMIPIVNLPVKGDADLEFLEFLTLENGKANHRTHRLR
jgi:hypothetical protein